VDRGYPRPLYEWPYVRISADAAFSYDDVTYFFLGDTYQVFDDDDDIVGTTFIATYVRVYYNAFLIIIIHSLKSVTLVISGVSLV